MRASKIQNKNCPEAGNIVRGAHLAVLQSGMAHPGNRSRRGDAQLYRLMLPVALLAATVAMVMTKQVGNGMGKRELSYCYSAY
jgi:hypothetical protein